VCIRTLGSRHDRAKSARDRFVGQFSPNPLVSASSFFTIAACQTIADQAETNAAGCLSALSYRRSTQWTVMGMLCDIKLCG
jgi:hypothetical protein